MPAPKNPGQPERRISLEHDRHDIVAGRLATERRALVSGHRCRRGRERLTRLELARDPRNIPHRIGSDPEKHARQPDRQDAEWIEHDGALELRHPPRSQAEDRDVGKGDRRQRDERVAEKDERRESLARQERRSCRRIEQRLDRSRKPAHPPPDDDERNGTEREKEHRLKRVDPGRASHSAEEDVAHHDESHDCAAEPVGQEPTSDRPKRSSAAHHADDDVGDQQRRLHYENHRADMPALPSISKHLHRGHEPMTPAERPHASADEEEGQGDDECRG